MINAIPHFMNHRSTEVIKMSNCDNSEAGQQFPVICSVSYLCSSLGVTLETDMIALECYDIRLGSLVVENCGWDIEGRYVTNSSMHIQAR